MKKTILFFAFAALTSSVFAQKLTTTSATVSFDATTAKDALPKAENNTVIAAVDTKSGEVNFEAIVKNFTFPNARIQEHFNGTNWLNSESFPTFTFSGKIEKLSSVNFKKAGSYTTTVKGALTIKGVTKPVSAPATILVKDGAVNASSEFSIVLSDYGISGAPIEGGKVSNTPKITVLADLK
jgi:polyisoprenoid-binding protein YceI